MEMKRCLFCDRTVPIKIINDCYRFASCNCAPENHYNLRIKSYGRFLALSHTVRREMFPLISAYIRDLTESNEQLVLSIDDLEAIRRSPRIPRSLRDKEDRLLNYLRKHSNRPNESVVIRRLPANYNLTYSPNQQEFVYILESLREKGWIERTGNIIQLTETGWKEADDCIGGKRLRPCDVVVPSQEKVRTQWAENVFPLLESLGYAPRFADGLYSRDSGDLPVRQLENKHLIADLTGHDREVYYLTGFASGQGLPVIHTMQRSDADEIPMSMNQGPFLVWDTVEDLCEQLQQHLIE